MSTISKSNSGILSACTICKESPKFIRLYKCNMNGHIVCYNCYVKLKKKGCTRCSECHSVLLKINSSHNISDRYETETIKIENLLQLPIDNLNFVREKPENTNTNTADHKLTQGVKTVKTVKENSSGGTHVPVKCPHLSCGKTVSAASLKRHFEYEHYDIKKYLVMRGEELIISTNVSIIEHGNTNCIAMIEVCEKVQVPSPFGNKVIHKKMRPTLFWVLVSGSPERSPAAAYAIYWLVTDSDNFSYKCTLEMTSESNKASCATLCGVNGIRDDLSIKKIEEKLNCLYLPHGSIVNLKGTYGEVNFRVTIH